MLDLLIYSVWCHVCLTANAKNHPEIVLPISSTAMPLFPPDPPSPTWNSEAEPPEPPEPLESDDDGNERFHGKMTNKISDAPASPLQMRFDFDAAPPPSPRRRPPDVVRVHPS